MHTTSNTLVINGALQLFLLLQWVDCSINSTSTSQLNPAQILDTPVQFSSIATQGGSDKPIFGSSIDTNPLSSPTKQELDNVLSLLPKSIRESARSYIASRLRKIILIPTESADTNETTELQSENVPNLTVDLITLSKSKNNKPFSPHGKRILGSYLVPIIPEGVPTPKWIPGELIASHISKRQIQLINDSMFGPLKSVTMFPSVMSSILVFNKRYNPESLGQILKYNFGVEAEPNGLIVEAPLR